MPTKRNVLAQLKRAELLQALDWYELAVDDRRVRDQLLDALAHSKKARLSEILPDLKRARLKEICGALDLDTSGREKSLLVDRLTGSQGQQSNGTGNGSSKATRGREGASSSRERAETASVAKAEPARARAAATMAAATKVRPSKRQLPTGTIRHG